MIGALNNKIEEYKNAKFENKEFRQWLKDSDLWMSVFTCLRVQGVEMDKKELVDVLNGQIALDVPMNIYSFVHGYKDASKEMNAAISMQTSMNEKLFVSLYEILFDKSEYRSGNAIIYKWGYIAPHFNEISEKLAELFRDIARTASPIEKAVKAHNGVAEIYPFGDDTAAMACVAMYYELMKAGIPLPSFTADAEEYNKLMTEHFDRRDNGIDDMILRSLMNRIDSVLILGYESRER